MGMNIQEHINHPKWKGEFNACTSTVQTVIEWKKTHYYDSDLKCSSHVGDRFYKTLISRGNTAAAVNHKHINS